MTSRNAPLLRAILEGKQALQAHAQPVLGLRTMEPVAQEYLTRFVDPKGRLLTLADLDFVKLDDATRLDVDLICLDSTFRALRDQPPSSRLHFINVEPMTLESPRFWGKLQGWLSDLQIPPLNVVVEFTESHGIHDLDLLQNCAKSLRSHGLQLAVDDLGAGVASLTHMARLAPDFIKADRSLVEQAHRRPYQAALLNALSVFAQRMCIGFIAEGIETAEELQAVIDATCLGALGPGLRLRPARAVEGGAAVAGPCGDHRSLTAGSRCTANDANESRPAGAFSRQFASFAVRA